MTINDNGLKYKNHQSRLITKSQSFSPSYDFPSLKTISKYQPSSWTATAASKIPTSTSVPTINDLQGFSHLRCSSASARFWYRTSTPSTRYLSTLSKSPAALE